MAGSCPDCAKPFGPGRPPVTTVTGRKVCKACLDDTSAAAAGALTSPSAPVEGAVATRGWFRKRRRRPPG